MLNSESRVHTTFTCKFEGAKMSILCSKVRRLDQIELERQDSIGLDVI